VQGFVILEQDFVIETYDASRV